MDSAALLKFLEANGYTLSFNPNEQYMHFGAKNQSVPSPSRL